MARTPNQALFIKAFLPADFHCAQQSLPDRLKVLLCLLEGAERRQRLQAKFEFWCPQKFVDSPADVHWTFGAWQSGQPAAFSNRCARPSIS
jgi:hypothetical protein